MEILPAVCPQCGDQMSTPFMGRHSRRLISTCRNDQCRHTMHSSSPVTRAEDHAPRPGSSDHHAPVSPAPVMAFRPARPRPAPPSALERFEEAQQAGDTRKAITRERRRLSAANSGDAQLKRLGRDR